MRLAILVCAYNMERELPRVVCTLGRPYQRGIDGLDYEIVILDNGSTPPVDATALQEIAPNLRVVKVESPKPSPLSAINAAVEDIDCEIVGLWIDGARMASPGMLYWALQAHKLIPNKVIGTLAFHLGPDVQMRSRFDGYNREAEDRLLETIDWRDDGYKLFEVSVLAGSSIQGWFGSIAESNAVFMEKALWKRIGGLDERFTAPGGGVANLEFWRRCIEYTDRSPWIILGEGTFHQVHGGAATSGSDRDRAQMFAEYKAIFGMDFERVEYQPCFVGTLGPAQWSAGMAAADSHRRVHTIGGRPFKVGLSQQSLTAIQQGTLKNRYRGLRFAKNPFDVAIYSHLLQQLRPRSIIEIGISEGGSALWFCDQCRALGLHDTTVLGIDRNRPKLEFTEFSFFLGDSEQPEATFPSAAIDILPHPWLVVEDSAHTYSSVSAVLNYFRHRLQTGDYLVAEDGVVADLPQDPYGQYEDGPNRAVAEFLRAFPGEFEIDSDLCDRFGPNVTYCPNAWLRRVA